MAKVPEVVAGGQASGEVWPGAAYQRQIERLKDAVGQSIYLAEVRSSDINLSVTMESKAFELLAVIDFPRPDPEKNLYPHLLLLDDGRGLNMGHVARVSLHQPFQPGAENILYQDGELLDTLMYCERSLTRSKIDAVSREALGAILDPAAPAALSASVAPTLGGSRQETDGEG
jgi:hypothetical protein